MKINDKVFGELKYELRWYGESFIAFKGERYPISLSIDGDEKGIFQKIQYEEYSVFMEKLNDDFIIKILNTLLDYYKKERIELGYDEETYEKYPPIETVEELLNHIRFESITVFCTEKNKRQIGLTFECDWDEENGVGIYFVNEKIEDIGYQNVAI